MIQQARNAVSEDSACQKLYKMENKIIKKGLAALMIFLIPLLPSKLYARKNLSAGIYLENISCNLNSLQGTNNLWRDVVGGEWNNFEPSNLDSSEAGIVLDYSAQKDSKYYAKLCFPVSSGRNYNATYDDLNDSSIDSLTVTRQEKLEKPLDVSAGILYKLKMKLLKQKEKSNVFLGGRAGFERLVHYVYQENKITSGADEYISRDTIESSNIFVNLSLESILEMNFSEKTKMGFSLSFNPLCWFHTALIGDKTKTDIANGSLVSEKTETYIEDVSRNAFTFNVNFSYKFGKAEGYYEKLVEKFEKGEALTKKEIQKLKKYLKDKKENKED